MGDRLYLHITRLGNGMFVLETDISGRIVESTPCQNTEQLHAAIDVQLTKYA